MGRNRSTVLLHEECFVLLLACLCLLRQVLLHHNLVEIVICGRRMVEQVPGRR